MRLGIDIDNVISDFSEDLFRKYLLHDREIRNNGVVNINAEYIRKGMFDWSEDEEKTFYKNNIERIVENLCVKKKAKEYIDKLHKNGHSIYIITGRDNGEYIDPYNMTKKWLDDNNIYYDALILTNSYDKHAKSQMCMKYNIDIMFDDSVRICNDCIDNRITAVLMDTPYNKYSNIKRVRDWEEFYQYVMDYKKINLILDTDAYNECDDQFALAYLLKCQDLFNIEAITIAPFSHKSVNVSTSDGQKLSYNEILKICSLEKFNTDNKVFMGS